MVFITESISKKNPRQRKRNGRTEWELEKGQWYYMDSRVGLCPVDNSAKLEIKTA